MRTWDESEEYMVDEIYTKKVYEMEFSLAPNDIVVDVGANIGAFSVRASKMVGAKGKVIAIEPESTNFGLLTENLSLNHAENVKPIRAALGDERGTLKLNVYRKRGNNSIFPRRNEIPEGVENVPMETLDLVCNELESLNFLKIDVEGAEMGVLRGGKNCIEKFKPKIALETHPWGPPTDELIGVLRSYGYSTTKFVPADDGLGLIFAT